MNMSPIIIWPSHMVARERVLYVYVLVWGWSSADAEKSSNKVLAPALRFRVWFGLAGMSTLNSSAPTDSNPLPLPQSKLCLLYAAVLCCAILLRYIHTAVRLDFRPIKMTFYTSASIAYHGRLANRTLDAWLWRTYSRKWSNVRFMYLRYKFWKSD